MLTHSLTCSYFFHTDPDVPFVPSMDPSYIHVMTDHDEMEIPCRASDPTSNVSLVNVETQQVVDAEYDSKRGFIGMFNAGTYICKALVGGQEHLSEEYIVHGWAGVCMNMSARCVYCGCVCVCVYVFVTWVCMCVFLIAVFVCV